MILEHRHLNPVVQILDSLLVPSRETKLKVVCLCALLCAGALGITDNHADKGGIRFSNEEAVRITRTLDENERAESQLETRLKTFEKRISDAQQDISVLETQARQSGTLLERGVEKEVALSEQWSEVRATSQQITE